MRLAEASALVTDYAPALAAAVLDVILTNKSTGASLDTQDLAVEDGSLLLTQISSRLAAHFTCFTLTFG